MRYSDQEIKTLGNLVTKLRSQTKAKNHIWFRGQSKHNWKLLPSLARDKNIAGQELALIKRFKQNSLPHISSRPLSDWEWLFLMQHYRLPTRLLDWTESPLVALFFAIECSEHRNTDAALWCLDPVGLNHCANITFKSNVEVPAFDHDDVLQTYLPSSIATETTSDLHPIAAIAIRNSPRIAAQLGTFTITHRTHEPIEKVGDGKHVWRLIIPKDAKAKLLEELALLKISHLTLFPELDSVAKEAVEILA